MSITERLRKFLRCNLAVLIVSSAVVVLPVAMQSPQRANAAAMTGFTQVAVGDDFTCGLKAVGTVWCWGLNSSGQLGNNTTTSKLYPVQVTGLTDVSQIVAGLTFACALKTDKTVACWGENTLGQLGDGSNTTRTTATAVSNLSNVTRIAASFQHVCALLSVQTVRCWGSNLTYQLGNGSNSDSNTPVQVSDLTGVLQVSAGAYNSCALLSDETVRCWGQGSLGNLGNGSTPAPSSTKTSPSGISGVAQVGLGGAGYQCVILKIGTVKCWGNNGDGTIGDGSTTTRLSPVDITSGFVATAVSIDAGLTGPCAILVDGRAMCWGWGTRGQTGDGVATTKKVPTLVSGLTTVTQISAGQFHRCAVLADSSIKCWGDNPSGQLGDGTFTRALTPVSVSAPPSLVTPTSVVGSATSSTLKSIGVSWTAVANASSYTVKLYDASGTTVLGTQTGVTTTSTTITSSTYASIADGTSYKVNVTAIGDGSQFLDSSASAQVSVTTNMPAASPVISSQPASVNRTSGQTASFSVTATSSDGGTLSYVWKKDGASISGGVSSTLTLSSITSASAAAYTVVVTNTLSSGLSSSTTSSAATLTISGALTIATPTTGLFTTANRAFSLAVPGAGGRAPLTYTWSRAGSWNYLNIDASTGTISGTPLSNAGLGVSVTVTDANGATATTSIFTIMVASNLTIATPTTGLNQTGLSAFSRAVPGAGGRAPLTYALNGTLLNGLSLDASTGTISGTPTVAGASTVSVTVTDANGATATTSNFTIFFYASLTIATPTTGLFGTANSAFSRAVPGAGGRPSLTYALTGTLVNGLSFSTSTGTISGTPTVAGSSTVSVTVTDVNAATASTSDFTISIGYASTTVSLALSSASPQYRTTNTITATTSRAGTVNFKLGGISIVGCESVTAATTTATCDWVPVDLGAASLSAVFTPTSSTAYANSTASLSTTVAGRAITITPTANQSKLFGGSDPVFQYSITSGSLYGLDTLTGALSRAAGEDVGTYQIAIGSLSNANYVITLAPVNFTVRRAGAPTISTDPTSVNKTSGQSVTFTVVATSPDAGTLSYQWFKDGAAIANATLTMYTIDSLSTADEGSYTVMVTNSIGDGVSTSTATTTSSAATLTVSGALSITTPTAGLSGPANSAFSLAVPGAGGRASLSYALTGTLVNGLSIDALTGTISGTPTLAGTSSVSVTVTDANGATAATSNFTLSIGYASTSVSLALASASPQYRISNTITATTSRAGTVNFKLAGIPIAGCESVVTSTTTATCAWVPVDLGAANLTATFSPTDSSSYSNSNASLGATVVGRAITVTPTAGQSKVFGNSEPVMSYSITSGSLYGLDTLSGALSRVAGEDVGTYQIAQGTLSNANYAITLAPVNFAITQATQAAVSLTTFSGEYATGLTLAASGGSGSGAYSFAVISTGTAGCSITSGVLNATSTGTCTVAATRAASTNYLIASSGATTVTIVKANQSAISLTSTSGTFNSNISLTASGGTGTGGYSFSVSDMGTAGCSILSGTTLTSSSAGSCNVIVTRAGDSNYESRSSVATLVTFAKDTQNALTLRDSAGDLDSGITLSVSGGSGTGAVSYSVTSGSASCSITSGVVSARFVGSCTLTSTKSADTNYLQKQITNTLTFIKATQSPIQVTSTSGTYGTPIQLTITGGSGSGSLSYAVSDTGSASCVVSGTQLTFTSTGTCKVTATRDADNVFDARSSIATTITIDRSNQTPLSLATSTGDLVTGIIVSVTGGGGTGSVSTSVTSGTANCTLTAGLVTARNFGTCSLSIAKAGDTNFFSASATVTLTFAKALQSSGTVSSPTSSALGTGITLGYTGGTGNGAITYTLVSAGTAGCTITNGVLNATSGGKCTVTITKQGDDTYADQVTTTEFTFIDSNAPSTTTTTTIARAASTGVTTPKATPTTTTIAIPTTTVARKKQVLPPSLVNTPSAVGAATIGGKVTKAKTTRVNNQLVFTAGGFTVTLAGVNADGTIIPLSSDGLLEVKRGDMFRLDAQGFAPNSTVNIWMFSKTFLMDTIEVGADGLVKSTLKVPKSVEDGLHHLVMVGVDRAKAEANFEVGMNVGVPPKQWWFSRILIVIPISIAVFIGFWLPTSASRRRRRRTT